MVHGVHGRTETVSEGMQQLKVKVTTVLMQTVTVNNKSCTPNQLQMFNFV